MKRDEFERNMTQLLKILKKMLKSHHTEDSPIGNLFDPKNLEKTILNICFFNFVPVSPETLSELHEAFESSEDAEDSELQEVEGVEFGWNEDDIDFLKGNGIRI